MLSLQERIELIERDLKATPPAFAMSSDLPFAIFRYDPFDAQEGEWRMRREMQKLAVRVQNSTKKTVHTISLAKLYWRSIEESEGLDALVELERERGFGAAEEQVSTYLSDPDWCPLSELLVEDLKELDPSKDVAFLFRAGVFAPNSYRLSCLLEQLMGRVRVPAVLFYPGSWTGSLNYMNLRTEEQPMGSYRVKIYGRD